MGSGNRADRPRRGDPSGTSRRNRAKVPALRPEPRGRLPSVLPRRCDSVGLPRGAFALVHRVTDPFEWINGTIREASACHPPPVLPDSTGGYRVYPRGSASPASSNPWCFPGSISHLRCVWKWHRQFIVRGPGRKIRNLKQPNRYNLFLKRQYWKNGENGFKGRFYGVWTRCG